MTTELKRKFRKYGLLVVTVGFFSIAADGCPACNFVAPEYGLFHLVVSVQNHLEDQKAWIMGPGEFLGIDDTPAKLLNAVAGQRLMDAGEKNDGDSVTFTAYSSTGVFLVAKTCKLEAKYTGDRSSAVLSLFEGAMRFTCWGGLKD